MKFSLSNRLFLISKHPQGPRCPDKTGLSNRIVLICAVRFACISQCISFMGNNVTSVCIDELIIINYQKQSN